jgi:hypothetical protein
MKPFYLLLLLVACCGTSTGSSLAPSDGGQPADVTFDAGAPGDAGLVSAMPRLAAGNHLGLWRGYELPDPAHPVQTSATDAKWQDARTAGLRIGRVHVAWSDLEPSKGVFDLHLLTDALKELKTSGIRPLVLIETVDSDGFSLPTDLDDGATAYQLAGGRAFDDPVILGRFAALLDAVVPALDAASTWALTVGNEPDSYLDRVGATTSQGKQWVSAVAHFLAAAREHTHKLSPQLPVTMTLRQSALAQGVTTLGPILTEADVASFNYYCQDASYQVEPASTVGAHLDQLLAATPREVVLQELGCPAGLSPSVLSATEAAQAAFFDAVISRMKAEPRLRAAFVFQQIDWSPTLAKQYSDPYRSAYPKLADQVQESLATMGLMRWSDGTPRPAWPIVLAGIQSLHGL